MNEQPDYDKTLSKLEDSDLVCRINKDWKEGDDASSDWRTEAIEDYEFKDGHQWSADDKKKLDTENRPTVTFNRIQAILSAILGIEANQRNETSYVPRENADTALADAISEFTNWQRDYADIDVEEATAFEDMITCGMGWIESRMDYDTDLDGKYIEERVDPLEMRWDPSAKKRNLTDRRWQARGRKMRKAEILEKWPDADLSTGAEQVDITDGNLPISVINTEDRYKKDNNTEGNPKDNGTLVIHHQWFETEPVYRAQHPATGQIIEMNKRTFEKAQEFITANQVRYVKQKKRVYYQAFVAGKELLEKSLCPSQTGFSFKAITGKHDHIKNEWYGIVRAMKDPQKWSNKFFSQILDIINSNAKGGIMAETGAFVNPKKAEEEWAKANSITLMKDGAISNGKVTPKPVAPYPTGLDRLMEFSISAVREVPGIPLELLGMVDRQQAGVLEESRKRSAYTTLAPFFDSLRAFRKENGLLQIEFIKNFIPVQNIARVLSQEYQQYAQAIKQIDLKGVDVVVTEAPQSENNKQITWAFITQVAPYLQKAGVPVPPEILDYSPLPAPLAEKWKGMISGDPLKDKIQQVLQELGIAQQKAEVDKTTAEAHLTHAKAQNEEMRPMYERMNMEAQANKQLPA